MFKSKLQELCQKNEWPLPDYTTVKLGPGHCLRFKSTVTVNGLSFEPTDLAKQLKEAQNEAARLAYDHFTASASASVGTFNAAGGTPLVLQREVPITDSYQGSQNNAFLMVRQLPIKPETVQTIHNDAIPVTQHRQLPSGTETFQTPCNEETPAVQRPPNRQEAQNEAARLAYDHFTTSASIGTFNAAGGTPLVLQREVPITDSYQGSQNNAFLMVRQPIKPETVQTIHNDAIPVTQHRQLPSGYSSTFKAVSGTPVVPQREVPITDSYQASQNNAFLMVRQLPIKPETVQTIHNDRIPMTQHRQLPSGTETFQTPCSKEIPAVQRPPNRQETLQNLHNVGDKTYKGSKDMQIFKNQLQIFAQKRSLPLPLYDSECEGPPHARRFKCKVMIDGKTYECMEFFNTVKEAEHAAARIALQSLSPDGLQEENLIFYKNLLQEFTQKAGFYLPTYNTTSSGSSHNHTFIAHVEVEGEVFQGEESKTKKQAEMNAAKVAYLSLKEREMGQMPKLRTHNCQSDEALAVNSQSIVATRMQESMKSEDPDLCSTETRGKDEDVAVILSSSKGVNGRYESKQDMSSARKRDSSTQDSASVQDPSPPTSSLRLCDPPLPYFSASLVSAPYTNQPASSSSLVNKVRIFPFTPNMMLPDGVIVCGDEKWVAVKSMPDQSRN